MNPQFIFFYGTLMNPEVYRAVTGKRLLAESAELKGYQICSLRNRVYPGIIPSADSYVIGLYQKVQETELDQLDWFEGDEYDRRKVEIHNTKGEKLLCWAYVLKEACQNIIENKGWDYEFFVREHLEEYLS